MTGTWTFDPPTGVWMNPAFSDSVRQEAEAFGGAKMVLYTGTAPLQRGMSVSILGQQYKVHEYGAIFPGWDGVDEHWLTVRISQHMSRALRIVTQWVLGPHLRRQDGSVDVCDTCQQEFKLPGQYGRYRPGDDHLRDSGHLSLSRRRAPGNSVAWYGIGFSPTTASGSGSSVVGLVLAEAGDLPIPPMCAKPSKHAPDCECATL